MIGDFISILSGYAFKSELFNEDGHGIPIIRIRDVGKEKSSTYYSGSFPDEYIINNGDYLIGLDGEFRIAQWQGGKALLNQRVCKINTDEQKLNSRYLYYALQKELKKIEDKTSFATVKHLSVKKINAIQIPLPPLPEQKRIAALLDAADSLRQKDKALLAKYDELSKSLFLEMFGDPVRNEKGWEKVPTIKYSTCVVPGRDKPKSFTGKTPWITTSDLIHLGATFDSKMNIGLSSDEIREVKSKVIPVDSVIMTCVGELGIVSTNKSEIVVNQQLHAFICGKELNNVFLMHNLSFQKPYMIKMASSTTVPYMNKTIANNTPTIVPPIELQIQFAERVKIIETQKRQVELSLAKSEEIFRGVMGEVFK